MEVVGSQYKRAIYAIEFEDNSVYVGLTFNYDVRYHAHLTQDKYIGIKLRTVAARFVRFNKWFALDRAGIAEAKTIKNYRNRGWTILNRMKPGGVGSRPEKWSYEEVKELTARYKTVKRFKAAHPSAYIVAHRKGWWPDLSRHMTRAIDHGKWTFDAVSIEARKYSTRKHFQDSSPGAYSRASKNGWLNVICEHMKRQFRPANYWTFEVVAEEAKRFETRKKFQEGAEYAYQKAYREGWLEDVCAHMRWMRKPNGYWTFRRCADEALKSRTRGDFKRHRPSAFQRARMSGWLDRICQHMKKGCAKGKRKGAAFIR
jgi:predicted GIY-YIG superfamily endonuclease